MWGMPERAGSGVLQGDSSEKFLSKRKHFAKQNEKTVQILLETSKRRSLNTRVKRTKKTIHEGIGGAR